MLVLSRRPNEKILLPSANVTVEVVSIKHGSVRLGIEAPRDMAVYREELWNKTETPLCRRPVESAQEESQARELRHMIRNRLNVATIGLALLRRQIENGLMDDAQDTIERMANDFDSLKNRMETEATAAAAQQSGKPKPTALVVEDDRNECELLAGFLRVAGVEVATADDGTNALDYLRTHRRPDFMLLDMFMPRCDGATMVNTIRRDPHFEGLKIFAVTGHSPDEFGMDVASCGIDRWFRKPLNPESLLREVTQELAIDPGKRS